MKLVANAPKKVLQSADWLNFSPLFLPRWSYRGMGLHTINNVKGQE